MADGLLRKAGGRRSVRRAWGWLGKPEPQKPDLLLAASSCHQRRVSRLPGSGDPAGGPLRRGPLFHATVCTGLPGVPSCGLSSRSAALSTKLPGERVRGKCHASRCHPATSLLWACPVGSLHLLAPKRCPDEWPRARDLEVTAESPAAAWRPPQRGERPVRCIAGGSGALSRSGIKGICSWKTREEVVPFPLV